MACNPNGLVEGVTPVIEMTFRDIDDVLEDPLTITAVHRKPDGVEDTYTQAASEVTNQSTGIWHLTLPAVLPGNHLVTVIGNGTATTAANKVRFKVKSDGVAAV